MGKNFQVLPALWRRNARSRRAAACAAGARMCGAQSIQMVLGGNHVKLLGQGMHQPALRAESRAQINTPPFPPVSCPTARTHMRVQQSPTPPLRQNRPAPPFPPPHTCVGCGWGLRAAWGRRQTEWAQRLEELRDFKRATGHCSVPMKFPSNPGKLAAVAGGRAGAVSSGEGEGGVAGALRVG